MLKKGIVTSKRNISAATNYKNKKHYLNARAKKLKNTHNVYSTYALYDITSYNAYVIQIDIFLIYKKSKEDLREMSL